ncbi:RNA methyltransferase [Phenylobacterium immobile]|uniref:TrmH family RNA methyltransferase n=1 Tax=Phenylobacterium immobile TaxID=21 RepID=UPI000AAD06BB
MIEPVGDPLDPRIEPYAGVRERDLVGRDGAFIAEGRVVLEKLIAAGRHPVRSVLVAEPKAPGLADVLTRLDPAIPVYMASQAVMDALVGFHIHRGVLALGERRETEAPTLLAGLPDKALVVGLSAVANHDNMGGVFRNAAAFGADAVLLDSDCCDPLYRKAIRVSVGAALTTPFARLPRGVDMVELLSAAGFEAVSLSPRGATQLTEYQPAPRTAVIFGAEGPGLAEAVMARTRTVRIAMSGGFDSLNLATTSGIVLHALARRA